MLLITTLHPPRVISSGGFDSISSCYDIYIDLPLYNITLLIFENPSHMVTSAIASQPKSAPTIRTFEALKHAMTRSAWLIITPKSFSEGLSGIDLKTRNILSGLSHCKFRSWNHRHVASSCLVFVFRIAIVPSFHKFDPVLRMSLGRREIYSVPYLSI